MAEPFREQVMTAVAARLATIAAGPVDDPSYAGRTVIYATTPGLVTRTLLWINQYEQPLAPPDMATQLDQGPVLGVVRGSGSMFQRLEHAPTHEDADIDSGGDAGALLGYEHQMRFTIWGYCKAGASTPVATILERLWWDHISAILVEPTLSGLAKNAIPDGPLDTDDGVLEPLAYFAQDWLVTA